MSDEIELGTECQFAELSSPRAVEHDGQTRTAYGCARVFLWPSDAKEPPRIFGPVYVFEPLTKEAQDRYSEKMIAALRRLSETNELDYGDLVPAPPMPSLRPSLKEELMSEFGRLVRARSGISHYESIDAAAALVRMSDLVIRMEARILAEQESLSQETAEQQVRQRMETFLSESQTRDDVFFESSMKKVGMSKPRTDLN